MWCLLLLDEDDSRSPLLERALRRDLVREFRSFDRDRRLDFDEADGICDTAELFGSTGAMLMFAR